MERHGRFQTTPHPDTIRAPCGLMSAYRSASGSGADGAQRRCVVGGTVRLTGERSFAVRLAISVFPPPRTPVFSSLVMHSMYSTQRLRCMIFRACVRHSGYCMLPDGVRKTKRPNNHLCNNICWARRTTTTNQHLSTYAAARHARHSLGSFSSV